jgi:hypothetical protein
MILTCRAPYPACIIAIRLNLFSRFPTNDFARLPFAVEFRLGFHLLRIDIDKRLSPFDERQQVSMERFDISVWNAPV